MFALRPPQGEARNWRAVQDQIRDASLSLILVLQISIIFISAPLAAKGSPVAQRVADVLTWAMVIVIVLLSQRLGAILLILLGLLLIAADSWASTRWSPAVVTVLGGSGSVLGLSALTWVVASAVFAPGRITAQRLQGAVVIYLNLAMIFASAYRLIAELDPGAFTNRASEYGTLLYFSLTTLTTTGYGDIAAIDPFARGLANLEAVIGQFYLAITIARLVSLQVAEHR